MLKVSFYRALTTFLGRNHIQDDMFIHCEATLPLGIVGSLKPILVPTLKLTSTFALEGLFPFNLRKALHASITLLRGLHPIAIVYFYLRPSLAHTFGLLMDNKKTHSHSLSLFLALYPSSLHTHIFMYCNRVCPLSMPPTKTPTHIMSSFKMKCYLDMSHGVCLSVCD